MLAGFRGYEGFRRDSAWDIVNRREKEEEKEREVNLRHED
jgi:hypothetical protein